MTSIHQHGTSSGYTYHYTVWKTPACDACKAAHKRSYKRLSEAQSAAISRLKAMHPTVYRALFDEEKTKRGL
jgi:hypothetical protein